MRLQLFLAKSGVASRREAEKWIAAGRVRVNGQTVTRQGVQVDPEKDSVEADGRKISLESRLRYFIFHKPEGVTTTLSDPHAERTVADYFRDVSEKIVPAGRLDKNSTGLLLLTNDGDLVHKLTHPRFEVWKEYRVLIRGEFTAEHESTLEHGIPLYGKKTAPCRIEIGTAKGGNTELKISLREGRKREIREMMKFAGVKVVSLKRVSYGPLDLGKLKPGERRELSQEEEASLKRFAGREHLGRRAPR